MNFATKPGSKTHPTIGPVSARKLIQNQGMSSNSTQNKEVEFPVICNHAAVRMDHTIVVFGGSSEISSFGVLSYYRLRHTIWIYNLYIEQWRRYRIPKWKPAPKDSAAACGVVIEEDIFAFFERRRDGNELWKLTRNTYGCFAWTKILIKEKHKNPSPRARFSGWEYNGELFIFGLVGQATDDYLNEYGDYTQGCNNQLLQLNPNKMEWTNLKSSGTVPGPRYSHATAAIKDKVWLYGGQIGGFQFFMDLYELDMPSLTWSKIHTGHHEPKVPYVRFGCRLNVTTDSKLVLYGSLHRNIQKIVGETWIMDLPLQTWRIHSPDRDSPRFCHTESSGINNSVTIIGGWVEEIGMYKCVCNVMLEPKSLQQLAIKTVYEHRTGLPWRWLPKKLIKLMHYGRGDDAIDDQDSPQQTDKTDAPQEKR